MRVAVITPCLAPTRDFIRLLDESATRSGIDLIPHGIGRQFSDWRTMLVAETIPEMRRLSSDYSHVLYVDGRDSLFVAPLSEIVAKYKLGGSPRCVISSDDQFPSRKIHVNAGGYLAEIEFMVNLWLRLEHKYPNEGDYQNWLQNEWPIEGMGCDTESQIFQSVEAGVVTGFGRVINPFTGQTPCILHFRGGYSDPERGREHRILPVLEQLYGAIS